MNVYQSKRRIDETAIYVFARCEQFIEDYARSSQIPAHELAKRVGELLFSQTGGTLLGLEDHLSALSGASAGNGSSSRSLALAGRPRGATQHQMSYEGRQRISQAQQERWARYNAAQEQPKRPRYTPDNPHWMQLPKNRAKIRKQLRKLHAGRRKKARLNQQAESHRAKTGMQNYWAKMTPEQRSAEIKRRQAITRRKQAGQ